MEKDLVYLKITYTKDWIYENRDRREIAVAVEMGFNTIVLKPVDGACGECKGYSIITCASDTIKNRIVPRIAKHIITGISWAKEAAKIEADIISGHNLEGVFIALLSNILRKDKRKAKIIYDAHEYLMGQKYNASFVTKKMNALIEKFVINHSDIAMFVNESIGKAVKEDYHLKKDVLVIRNVPFEMPEISQSDVISAKKEIDSLYRYTKEKFVVMYHGAIVPGRGIEELIYTIEQTPDVCGLILGYGSPDVIVELQNKLMNSPASDRLAYHGAVPQQELWKYLLAVDLGWVLCQPINRSYYYSLPNKFSECIQASLPMLASNFPEMQNIIEKYNIGMISQYDDLNNAKACLEKLKNKPDLYNTYKSNMGNAKIEMCWTKEKEKLISAIEKIM